MKINKIKKEKNGKYKIYIDDECIDIYDNIILNYNLLYKKEIDLDTLKEIKKEAVYYENYNKAINYIKKKIRSKKEVISYLNSLNLSKNTIDNIIIDLEKLSYINDKNYCRAYINDNIYINKYGINKIKKDLINNNIPIDIINNELELVDKEYLNKKLEKLILKKIKSNKKYSNNYLKNKILSDMMNLGYNTDDIVKILDSNLIDDNSILNKEYYKLYNKYKNKYNGNELDNIVKSKLIQKGFSIESIQAVQKDI